MYNHMCSWESPQKTAFFMRGLHDTVHCASSWIELEVDGRLCQGPGESTLMEMTVLERDSRGVMAPVQPSPLLLSCPNWLPSSASPHTVKTRHWPRHNYAVEINYCGKNFRVGIIHWFDTRRCLQFDLTTNLADFCVYLIIFKSGVH